MKSSSGAAASALRTARELAAAFGTSVDVWRNIDRANKQEPSTESASEEIDLRARVYSLGPVNELIHRG